MHPLFLFLRKVGALAAGLYMLFFGWLSFVVFPVVFLVAVTFHFF